MKNIVLQFVADSNIDSAVIEWYSHGYFSHVDWVMEDGRLLGARINGGVKIRQPGYGKFLAVKQVAIPVTDAQFDAFAAFMAAQLGKPYDIEAILAFVVARNWRDGKAWFCSELIAGALEDCLFFPDPLFSPVSKITPVDLILAISARTKVEA